MKGGGLAVRPVRLSTFLLTAFIPLFAHAQADFNRLMLPAPRDSNATGIRFERNLFTYVWNLTSAYRFNDTVWSLNYKEEFLSSFIKRDNRTIRDEQNFSLGAERRISDLLSTRIEAQSFILSDNQSLGISNAGIHSVLAGIIVRPISSVTVAPLAGLRFDKQLDQSDKGLEYSLHSQVDTVDLGGYRSSLALTVHQSDLAPRLFRNNAAQMFVRKEFAEGTSDSAFFRWYNNRWDFYIPADDSLQKAFNITSNIRSRSEQLFGALNFLEYHMGNGFSTTIMTSADSRLIENAIRYKTLTDLNRILFNTTVQEVRLEGAWDIFYRSPGMTTSFGIAVQERDEKHQIETIPGVDRDFQENRSRIEQRLNNTAVKTTLRGTLYASLSSDDVFSFVGSGGVLRYDTPDSLNTDDRDELLITLSSRETHRFSSALTASLTAEATIGHTVYLFRDRSAGNNWNRIFRLSPELYYTPSASFRMMNVFEVLANYTVFDFETVVPSVKSYSYRQVAFLDSTSYDITRKIGIDIFLNVRVYERGELHWQEFTERPQQSVEEVTFSPQMRYTVGERVLFAVGFRSFAQNRYRYVNTARTYDSDYLSVGPTTAITAKLSHASVIELRGWKEFQRQSGSTVREFTNMSLNVRYYF